VSLSLPSLRIDNFSARTAGTDRQVRKSSLTFAPEAGTQRMRDVINKNITEQEIMETCRTAFEGGYTAVKLYFMIGLPTETEEGGPARHCRASPAGGGPLLFAPNQAKG
jgi:radical SAM superfamily enzyme YgiQ (UPF0313 family)